MQIWDTMQKVVRNWVVICFITSQGICVAQSFSIKPHMSYTTVQMNDVNSRNQARVEYLKEITGETVPQPDPFEGNFAWGIQIGYHLENNYFLTFATYYFTENHKLYYQDESQGYPVIFDNLQSIKLFDISFGIKYFFRYSSWKRFNFYIAGVVGFAIGWSEITFRYFDEINSVNNKGDFSSNALTGQLMTGLSIRFSPAISLEPEIGYRAANLSQMDGKRIISQNFPNMPDGQLERIDNQYQTEAIYDFSGFFANIGLQFMFNL